MLLIKGAQNCLYVDNILAKANRSLGFVNRNLYPRSESTRRSYNYCQTELGVCCVELWELGVCLIGPLQARQIDKIEAVQRRGARFFKKDYERTSSVTEMSKSLNLDKLEDRRKVHRLSLFYFAVNNLIALPIPNYFLLKQYFTGSFHNISFIQPRCSHDYYLYSNLPRTIRDWNTLPSNIRASSMYISV